MHPLTFATQRVHHIFHVVLCSCHATISPMERRRIQVVVMGTFCHKHKLFWNNGHIILPKQLAKNNAQALGVGYTIFFDCKSIPTFFAQIFKGNRTMQTKNAQIYTQYAIIRFMVTFFCQTNWQNTIHKFWG